MNLLLQHPALLWLLGLVAVPVLVHLLSRTRPPVYRFSNIDFLRRVLRNTARLRKPQDRLLLLLRTLGILALIAAFLGPLLLSNDAPLPGERRATILLIDRSASMAAREGAGSRLDAACAAAAKFLGSARPDLANIVWIDSEPDAAFPEPGPNRSFLAEQLNQATVRPEPGALTAAFELALRQLENAPGRRELVVISDFQATAWKNFTPPTSTGIHISTIPVATAAPPNLAVTSLLPRPAEPVVGQQATILTSVRNFSPERRRTRLTLDAGGSRQSRDIDLPPWGESEVAFTIRCATSGALPLTTDLEADDSFPSDDQRHAILPVRESLRLVFAGPADSPDAATLARLAAALPWLEFSTAKSPDLAPGRADLLVIPAWDGASPDPGSLRGLADSGVTLLVRPLPGIAEAPLAGLLGTAPDPATPVLALDESPKGWNATPANDHPAFSLFKSGEFGNPFQGIHRRRLRIPARLADAAIPLARYADGISALLEAKSSTAAPILVLNLPLDSAATTWTGQAIFVPAFAELILNSRPRAATASHISAPGSRLSWAPADPSQATGLELAAPDGSIVPIVPANAPDGSPRWTAADPAVPGIYRWLVSGQPVHLAAVNFPESESDLRPLATPPAFGDTTATPTTLARDLALAQGLPLWPYLAAAALLFLLIESLVTAITPKAANNPI